MIPLPFPPDTQKKIDIIVRLALPAVLENVLQTVLSFVDTLFVAKLGLNQAAAVSVAGSIFPIYLAVFLALGVGTSSLIARSVGAGDLERAKAIAKQSTRLTVLFGLLFGLVTLLFAAPILRVMGAEPSVLADAVTYFHIIGIPSVFLALMTTFGSMLRAVGNTKAPMKVTFWINILHLGLDYLLIFGIGSFTGLGVAGAAWATLGVRVIGALALYLYVQRSPVSFPLGRGTNAKSSPYTRELLNLSTPAALERLIMRVGQVLYFGMIVHLGTKTFDAHMFAGNIEGFSYMPAYGFAVAATTLVGQEIGAGRPRDAQRYGLLATGIAMVVMSLGGVILFFLSPWFASWFTHDAAVIHQVVVALRIDAFAQPALAVMLLLAGALQGAGDTKSPMYSTAVGIWGIRVAGTYLLGVHLGLGIAGVWLAIALDYLLRAVYLFLRFQKKMSTLQA